MEHQSRSGLNFRAPVELLESARVDLGDSTLDSSAGARTACRPPRALATHGLPQRGCATCTACWLVGRGFWPICRLRAVHAPNLPPPYALAADAVLVASVFKDTGDWVAGELVVRQMAVKPWRRTLNGMIAMRVIEGSAWLCMQADSTDAPAADMHEESASRAEDEPAAPLTDDKLDESDETRRAKAHSDEPRLLCNGDWVCLPPGAPFARCGCAVSLVRPARDPRMRDAAVLSSCAARRAQVCATS